MGYDIDYGEAADTKPSEGRKPFLEGDVDFKLVVTKSENKSGYKGNNYIVEVRVLEAKATGSIAAPAVGAERVVIIDLDNERFGMPNLMAYAYGLNGGPLQGATKEERGAKLKRLLGERAIDEEEAKKTGKTARPKLEALAVGMVVGNRTNAGKTGEGEPFTYHNWYCLNQTMDQINARKAALKSGAEIKLEANNTGTA